MVLRLIDLALSLIRRVRDAPPVRPARPASELWRGGPFRPEVFRDGLEAIDWTLDERGLAGAYDLQGLPWRMQMDEFFESWVEAVMSGAARSTGGRLRVGRRRETVTPIEWEPAYSGSQRSLRPDLIVEQEDHTVLVDAKYKRHLERLSEGTWHEMAEDERERHRTDLLQVLAYSATAPSRRITAVLAYPCPPGLWRSLLERGRTEHVARIPAAGRDVRLVLAAVPLAGEMLGEAAARLAAIVGPRG